MPKRKKQSKVIHLQTSKTNVMKGVGKYRSKTKTTKLKGRGGYAEDIGSSIGSWLGKKAGGLFSSITGLGTYAVTKNSLMANPNDPPVLTNTRGGTRIQHREYIQDITGSTTFSLSAFPINPGVPATFPWLAGAAQNFEEYILHGLVFEFKSTSATALNSTNTALGTVIMATEYNVTNPVFVAKRDMENYVYSSSCSPDVSALHPVECARDINVLSELFVRNTIPVSGVDLRFSDIGLFQIATVGMQAASNIGELWVTYDIELIKPKLTNTYAAIGPAHFVFDTAASIPSAGSTAPVDTNYFGTSGSKFRLLGTGNSPVTISGNVITFNTPGRYMLINAIIGSGGVTPVFFTPTISSSVVVANIFYNGAASPGNGMTIKENNGVLDVHVYDVSSTLSTVPATVTYSGTPLAGLTVTGVDFLVFPLPSGFTGRHRTDIEILQDEFLQLKTLFGTRTNKFPEFDDESPSEDDFKSNDFNQLSNSTVINTLGNALSQAFLGINQPNIRQSATGVTNN